MQKFHCIPRTQILHVFLCVGTWTLCLQKTAVTATTTKRSVTALSRYKKTIPLTINDDVIQFCISYRQYFFRFVVVVVIFHGFCEMVKVLKNNFFFCWQEYVSSSAAAFIPLSQPLHTSSPAVTSAIGALWRLVAVFIVAVI